MVYYLVYKKYQIKPGKNRPNVNNMSKLIAHGNNFELYYSQWGGVAIDTAII